MLVTDLQIGQYATIIYWFSTRDGDDCATVSGQIVNRWDDRIEIDIKNSTPGWFTGLKIWLSNRSEVIKVT